MKKNVVMIHGSGVGGWVYDDISKVLKMFGYNTFAPSLSNIGIDKKDYLKEITVTDYAHEIIEFLDKEKLEEVYLIGHSFGGAVVSKIVDLIPNRVKKQIYIDSLFLENGESLIELFGEKRAKEMYEAAEEYSGGKFVPRRVNHPKIKDMPFMPYKEKVVIEGNGKNVPGLYIECTDTTGYEHLAAPKKIMVKRAKERGWEYVALDSDHLPLGKSPAREKLIEILMKAM